MSSSPTLIALAQWVVDFFQTGVTLDPDHQHYLRSTFGEGDPAIILDDIEDCEIESVLQLIFYPDHSLRLRYEHDWGESQWQAADVGALEARIHLACPRGRIHLGPDRPPLWVDLPAGFIRAWLERLRMTWRPAPEIAHGLSKISDSRLRAELRAHLRLAPIEWHGGQTTMVGRFLNQTAGCATAMSDLVDLLALLTAMRPDQPVHAFLGERKTFFFQSLCKAEDFEARRSRQAMEILMMQGCRAAFGSADHWRRQMVVVDRIARILFGTIPDIAPPDCRTRVVEQQAIGNIGVYK